MARHCLQVDVGVTVLLPFRALSISIMSHTRGTRAQYGRPFSVRDHKV